jgi:Fe-S-cluster containining protein
VITDLVQIRLLGEKKREENFRFRSYMKSHDHSDRILRRIAEDIQEQIDCTQCANCCREGIAVVTERDIGRLARHFRLKPDRIQAEYVLKDEEGDLVLRRRENGECVFLSGNECTVYEARPDVCQRYPHLVRGEGSIASRMWSMVDRAGVCPIVYNSLEAFKQHLRFRH